VISYQEKRNSLDGNVDKEEAQSTDVVVDVGNGSLDVVERDLLVLVGATLRPEPVHGDHALAFVQEVTFFRASGHDEGRSEADNHCEESLKEEDVAPCVDDHGGCSPRRDASKTVCPSAIDFRQQIIMNIPRSEQTTKGSSHRRSRDVDADTEQEFVALVEAGDEERKTTKSCMLDFDTTSVWEHLRHDTTLEYTKASPSSQQSLKALHKGTAERDEAKPTDQERQIELRANLLEQKIAGHLDKHVYNVKDGGHPIPTLSYT
jgi:hypothetical protein